VKRIALTAITVAALIFALLPALPAAASSTGTGRLLVGNNVLPGNLQDFAVEVRPDSPINFVVVDFPLIGITTPSTADAGIKAPDGWTGEVTTTSPTAAQTITFTGPRTGGVLTFEFKANVAAPLDRDRGGRMEVAMSSDGGNTFMPAADTSTRSPQQPNGSLNVTIRVLQVLETLLTAPAQVQDGTGTEYQDNLTVRTRVRNFAQLPLDVTPTLVASSPTSYRGFEREQIGAASPASAPIGSGGTATFDFPVTLGEARVNELEVGTRPVTFTGRASADRATALTSATSLDVQRAPVINLPSAADVAPRVVAPGTQQTFSLPLRKANLPGVTVQSGTLSFADTTCALDSPVQFAEGSNTDATLLFSCRIQDFEDRESFPANLVLQGIDSNGKPFSQERSPLRDQGFPLASTLNITIDGLIPVINVDFSLPLDGEGTRQTAVKNGDTVRVIGDVSDAASAVEVFIRPDVGPDITVPVEVIPDADTLGATATFLGQAQVEFVEGASSARVLGVATSQAGNVGNGLSAPFGIDNIAPVFDFAMAISTTDLEEVAFDGDYEQTAVQVGFGEDNYVIGGCNPTQWKVDGEQVVVAVLFSNGDVCEPGKAQSLEDPPDYDRSRTLLLAVPLDRDAVALPSVTYSPLPGDRARDGAGNMAPQRSVDTINGLLPPLPRLEDVYRNTGSRTDCNPSEGQCEDAYYDADEGSYYTRFAGEDLLVRVGRGAPQYEIQVLNELGVVVKTQRMSAASGTVRVPIGSLDGDYDRSIRFRNTINNLTGKAEPIAIVLDRVAPDLASDGLSATIKADGLVTMRAAFTEKVVEGTDHAANWRVYERNEWGDYATYVPNRIDRQPRADRPWQNDLTARLVTFMPRGDEVVGLDYQFNRLAENNERYADRAGNTLADGTGPRSLVSP
jgi:hypothetical protein